MVEPPSEKVTALSAQVEAFQQAGDAAGALKVLDELLELVPRNAAGRVNRAGIRAAMGDVRAAIADLDVAIEVDATLWPALVNRSLLLAAIASSLGSGAAPSMAATHWALATSDAARDTVASHLRAVPGRCTRGIAGRAWLGELAVGFDQGTYSAGDLVTCVQALYDPGFLPIDEAPYLSSVLRKVELGRTGISALWQALQPFVPVAMRLLETGQLEP